MKFLDSKITYSLHFRFAIWSVYARSNTIPYIMAYLLKKLIVFIELVDLLTTRDRKIVVNTQKKGLPMNT